MEITDQMSAQAPQQVDQSAMQAPAQEAAQQEAPVHNGQVTFDMLMRKPKRVVTVSVSLPDEFGEPRKVELKFQAITSDEYDELVSLHPPSKDDKERGNSWNSRTFPPALVAKTAIQPKMTEAQARELMDNDNWSSGEFLDLFVAANKATMSGFDVPFRERG